MKESYYIMSNGFLKKKDDTVSFISEDGIKRDIPIERIDSLYIMSEMTITTPLLHLLASRGVLVHFFNYYGTYTGSYYPYEHVVSGNVVINQVAHYVDYEKRINIARRFIIAAASNILRNLSYYNRRNKDLQEFIDGISPFLQMIPLTKSVQELMGIEGNIRRIYYNAWNIIVNQDINFVKRVMHPPDNMINSLISLVNSLLYSKIISVLYHHQLNPSISYLHSPEVRRFSLALDLSEPFKPVICDRLIFKLLNKNMITESCFTEGLNYLHLKTDAKKKILSELKKSLEETIMHKELKRSVSYQELLRLEAHKLMKHIMNEKEYEGFVLKN